MLPDLVRDATAAEVLATPVAESVLRVARGGDHVRDDDGVEGLVRTSRNRDVPDERAGLKVDLQCVGREVLSAGGTTADAVEVPEALAFLEQRFVDAGNPDELPSAAVVAGTGW